MDDRTESGASGRGPLAGVRVVEIGAIGPGPFAAMMLADMGADVLRVDRPVREADFDAARTNLLNRGRRSVAVDLKLPAGREVVLRLVERADVLVEGFRPGVMERLGLGPDQCRERNDALVFARMTGWGQVGPYAQMAGHDINYIALAGALAHIGRRGAAPTPPLNLVGDFGGGGMLMAFGIVCALLEARGSGRGQVVDAAMIDGVSLLMTMFWGMRAAGTFEDERGTSLLDSGAPFYDVYQCADGAYVSVGAIEPQFFADLCARVGIDATAGQRRANWAVLREQLATAFRTRTRDEWCTILDGTDSCFAPVLTLAEAAEHPHLSARRTVVDIDGLRQPAPAPRFSRTPGAVASPPAAPGEHTAPALRDWGFTEHEVDQLLLDGVAVAAAPPTARV